MIHLADKQAVTVSKIDTIVTALNNSHVTSPVQIQAGLDAIHRAIMAKP